MVRAVRIWCGFGEHARQQNVFAHGERRQETGKLKDKADLLCAQVGERGVVHRGEIRAVDVDASRAGLS